MDFTIDRADLIAAIDKCALAVPDPKHPTEAFRLMTVDATKKKSVRFAAVGEFCTVDTVQKATIKDNGTFNIYPRHLREIAGSMPAGGIQLSLKGSRVTVKSKVSSRKASFENHVLDVKGIDDPGKEAPWMQLDAEELVRVLRMVKAASTWEDGGKPVNSILVPTERGLDVFGCNGYLISCVESSIRIDGPPIQMPATAVAVLSLMAAEDAKVSIYCDGKRVYLENAETLVSAFLSEEPLMNHHPRLIGILKQPENITGPAFKLGLLQQGLSAVLSLGGFAGDSEKKSSRGYQVVATFGQSVALELGLQAADAKDEFDIIRPGSDLEFRLSSKFFDQLLKSLVGVDEVQALRADNMLVLRSQGVLAGIMEERPQ